MGKTKPQSCLNLSHLICKDNEHYLKYLIFWFLFWCHCWNLQNIFNWIACFLILCIFSSLYTLIINTLSSTHLAKILSHNQSYSSYSFAWLFLSCPEAFLFHTSHSSAYENFQGKFCFFFSTDLLKIQSKSTFWVCLGGPMLVYERGRLSMCNIIPVKCPILLYCQIIFVIV